MFIQKEWLNKLLVNSLFWLNKDEIKTLFRISVKTNPHKLNLELFFRSKSINEINPKELKDIFIKLYKLSFMP